MDSEEITPKNTAQVIVHCLNGTRQLALLTAIQDKQAMALLEVGWRRVEYQQDGWYELPADAPRHD